MILYDNFFYNFPINTNKEKSQGCYVKILEIYNKHLQDMLVKHSRVMQVRFDLRYPADGSIAPSPEHFQKFTEAFKRDLTRNNALPTGGRIRAERKKSNSGHNAVDPRLIRVSEKHTGHYGTQNPHAHYLTLVNGNAKRSGYDIFKRAERQWANVLKTDAAGLVEYCNKNGRNPILMDRNGETYRSDIDEAFYQASYLAKERGKEGKAKGSWLVASSRTSRAVSDPAAGKGVNGKDLK